MVWMFWFAWGEQHQRTVAYVAHVRCSRGYAGMQAV